MVKTRRMTANNSDNRPKKVIERNKVKKNSINAAVRSKKNEIKSINHSVEELMKVCRPFVIRIKRFKSSDKVKGNVLAKICFLFKRI